MPPTTHEKWMMTALTLAAKGEYAVSPNPLVGACLVKNDRLIATGFHKEFGGEHAEKMVLSRAGKRAEGATLYVTLEPCATWQKTPPCAPLIVEKGIKKVVIGALDPNPLNHKKGVRYLKRHGVQVVTGVLTDKIKEQNEGFFMAMGQKRPFVTLKMAETLDGKIATCKGLSRWISSPRSRQLVHDLRADQDGVLVGKHTFYKDNPSITVSPKSKCLAHGKPWKIVIVSEKGWSSNACIFHDRRLAILVFPENQTKRIMKAADRIKGHFTLLPVKDKKGKVDIQDLLKKLAALGVQKLLVEGGGELAWSFIEAQCVDRAIWILAPKVFGGRSAPTGVEGSGVTRPDQAFAFTPKKVYQCGEDWVFDGTFQMK